MRIALLQHPWQLTFRGKWDWSDIYNDPRGMSGSELGFVEIGKQLAAMGHDVHMVTDSDSSPVQLGPNLNVFPWADLPGLGGTGKWFDLAIGINHAGGLEKFDCPRIMIQWLNSHEYLSRAEYESVDLFLSPSEAHRDYIFSGPKQLADGMHTEDDRDKWAVVPLGCTPELYEGIEKVPGRVVYASSPDRGLHHLLQAWPSIKRRVPGAELKIYYRILPWIEELKVVPEPFPPVEENRQRALFIEDALRRLSDPKWGVEVVGPVSRNGIVKAMGEAECLAYPCDTLRWSEGFSVTTLEGLAAGARPVIWDCDALGQVYKGSGAAIIPRGDVERFAEVVVSTLEGPTTPEAKLAWKFEGEFAEKFVKEHTWRSVCNQLMKAVEPLNPTRYRETERNSVASETSL